MLTPSPAPTAKLVVSVKVSRHLTYYGKGQNTMKYCIVTRFLLACLVERDLKMVFEMGQSLATNHNWPHMVLVARSSSGL